MPVMDYERLVDFEPGTVLMEDGENDFVVIWGGRSVFRADAVGCVYGDPDTNLRVVSAPSPVDHAVIEGRDAIIEAVAALPPGSIFVETDDIGRRHRFITTWSGNVVIDNGAFIVGRYTNIDETASIVIESISR